MSENNPSDDTPVEEAIENVQAEAKDSLQAVSDYIKANPWTVVAGAAVLGGLIAILTRPKQPPTAAEVFRQWLDEVSGSLPSRKQIESTAKSAGLPCSLKELEKKLHWT